MDTSKGIHIGESFLSQPIFLGINKFICADNLDPSID